MGDDRAGEAGAVGGVGGGDEDVAAGGLGGGGVQAGGLGVGVDADVTGGVDDDGNRLSAGSTNYQYDARDELTSDGTASYSYTARGTLSGKTVTATDSTMAYSFDAYGQEATAGATSYTYDALGRDITADSTTLAYSGEGNEVASDGTTTYSRDASGNVTGENTPGTGAALTLTNAHSDVIGQFTATGTSLTGSASYDPWGNPVGTPTLTGTLGYQSEYTNPATSQVNMDARWYQPGTGSFNSADTQTNSPIADSTNANPFTYANDNPTTGTDPSGHNAAAAAAAMGETGSAEAINGPDDWNPIGWAVSGAILVGGAAYAGYEYAQNSRPLTRGISGTSSSSSAAADTSGCYFWA